MFGYGVYSSVFGPCLSWRHRVAAAIAGSADVIGRLAARMPARLDAMTRRGNPVSPDCNLPSWTWARVYGTRRLMSGAEGFVYHPTGYLPPPAQEKT